MKRLFIGLFVFSMILTSCSKNSGDGKSFLEVRLTDAPAAYEEVIIDVVDVKINSNVEGEEGEGEGWVSLDNVNIGEFNLLDLTNGLDTILATAELPAGKISQMRLVLGDRNKVKIDGAYYHLDTPSAQQSGLKFNIHADLQESITYRLWVDFDAGRSIVERGNGSYSLKPVIRTFTEATSGALKGVVNPAESKSYIMAISAASDTLGTYADTISGEYLIRGMMEGSYKVKFSPKDEYYPVEIDDVVIETGVVTELDTMFLQQK